MLKIPRAPRCKAKQVDIENQISYARAHNNLSQISSLEKALKEVQAHCTDSKLYAERQEKVREKERKVAEREQELKSAEETGNRDKIRKKQKKLAKAYYELGEAKDALTR
ncbi:DUF1090 domain-containing protein [Enterobacter mori]|uniref:DUF1090 domain-containing protein n=1 Tax=Enterobacter mori TaxID=539813 RepID=UPI001B8D9DE7|nr:DUF1090 domain-containing protein [Enterobacter mori]MBS3046434.1 DUF1090 family protein [Enterobacter mori]